MNARKPSPGRIRESNLTASQRKAHAKRNFAQTFGRNCLLAAPTAAPSAGREKTERILPPSGGKRAGGAMRAGEGNAAQTL